MNHEISVASLGAALNFSFVSLSPNQPFKGTGLATRWLTWALPNSGRARLAHTGQ